MCNRCLVSHAAQPIIPETSFSINFSVCDPYIYCAMALMLMSVLLAVLVVTTVSNAQTALTADDKQLLLNLHKTERSQVNPTAVNMEAMVQYLATYSY